MYSLPRSRSLQLEPRAARLLWPLGLPLTGPHVSIEGHAARVVRDLDPAVGQARRRGLGKRFFADLPFALRPRRAEGRGCGPVRKEPLSRRAVDQASRNLCAGADLSGAPTVPSFTKGIEAPGSNAKPRLAAFVFQASRDFWMFASISASTAGSSARATRGASVVAAASPAMRRRVNGSYAKACIDASKSASALCSAGMIDCLERGNAVESCLGSLPGTPTQSCERHSRQRAPSSACLVCLAAASCKQGDLCVFLRITPRSLLSVGVSGSPGYCAALG